MIQADPGSLEVVSLPRSSAPDPAAKNPAHMPYTGILFRICCISFAISLPYTRLDESSSHGHMGRKAKGGES